ncbi:hypothetical protein SAMN02745135_02041 [Caloranaerobacter azorensis DSM 13643]|uniref:SMODS-associated and fused to various effectors domain-containing protein n=1 Tax=Caloranaerobacter azorensis DSM 13643 TaxID=1121264 RepID=A0A1M5VPW4_9FIRM|nr:SAVED domain-containing protein [Caloranaerobacter azorensis]SHH76963.1 hypothetical protein SAMN02745135_02041 [Caloranaerobacter azorensis DSM 13643]
MILQLVEKIMQFIQQDKSGGMILLFILIVIAVILGLTSIMAYKNSKLLQRLLNYIPFIQKEYVMIANFSKKDGRINEVINNYLESGCKVFKLESYKEFADDGTISKLNLEKLVQKQKKTIRNAKKIMKNKNSLIYIGFPHVPLGFLDGVNFTDIDDPILYEYQGMDSECLGKGFFELKRIYNSSLNLVDNIDQTEIINNEVALKIEQSFRINDNEIRKVVNVSSIISFGPQNIGRWKITNYAQIDIYQKEFDKVITQLKNKGVDRIHLFAITPVSLSFSLGRMVKHYHPEIIVYNYNNGKFDWGINLRNQKVVFFS